jgi:hypothetical protein
MGTGMLNAKSSRTVGKKKLEHTKRVNGFRPDGLKIKKIKIKECQIQIKLNCDTLADA